MRESDFIEWICSQSRFDTELVPVGPGDDCAVVTCGSETLLVTTDQLLDGVHFVLDEHGARRAGRKAMGRGLSDVGAMAGAPLVAVGTVALPKGSSSEDAEEIYRGLRELSDEFHCPFVGGDVGVWDSPLGITVTVLARPDGIEPVLRSGAQVGDAVCVTGAFGGAWKTDRHLDFTPRVTEARKLATDCDLHAMIDVSDGLACDLAHICAASKVGAEVIADAVPIHPDAQSQETPLLRALGDGEDYELLFTLSPGQCDKLLQAPPLEIPITRIGYIVEDRKLLLVHGDGRREQLDPSGWEHRT